jgi:hypothetical protein
VPLAFIHLLDLVEARDAIGRRETVVRDRIERLGQERERVRTTSAAGRMRALRLLEQQMAFAEAELVTLAGVRRDLARSRR